MLSFSCFPDRAALVATLQVRVWTQTEAGAVVTWRGGLHENGMDTADDPELVALRSLVDLAGLPPLTRAVTEHVIGSTAELSYANDLVCSETWLEAAVAALAAGARVVADGPIVTATS